VGKKYITPTILQMESVECGAASLAIILAYYGRYEPLSVMRQACGVARDGTNATNVLKAARSFGLKAKGFSKNIENIQKLNFPLIVFWEFNHFLVVERFEGNWVLLNDPARGHRRMTLDEFEEGFTGVTLTFEKTDDFEATGKPLNPYKFLLEKMAGSKRAITFILLAGILGIVPSLVQAVFSKIFVDSVMIDAHFDWIRPIVVAIIAVTLFQLAAKALEGFITHKFFVGQLGKMNADFNRHLLDLPYLFYSQRSYGDVVGRSEINQEVVELMTQQLSNTVIGFLKMLLFGTVLLAFHVGLTLIGIAAVLMNYYYLKWIAERRQEANLRTGIKGGKLVGLTVGGLSNMDTLKSSGIENSFFGTWAGSLASYVNAQTEQQMHNRMINALPVLTTALVTSLVLILGGIEVLNGQMTLGTLVAFSVLMTQFMTPMNDLLNLSSTMQEARGNILRLEDVLKYPSRQELYQQRVEQHAETDDIKATNPAEELLELQGYMSCEALNFRYIPIANKPFIDHFNLQIQPGERVALVGGSGSGKSTVAKLVAGLLVPESGSIRFDNINREQIPEHVLSQSIAIVEQNFSLFPGTIRENLTLWDDTILEERIVEALEDAVLLDDVLALPGGLDARIEQAGSNFSGGQQQRLEISRALVRQPVFLVFDEATSALDVETEALIMQNLQRRGCSALIVAHRLSTIKSCHKIIVMEKGKIVEEGTHQDLLKADGRYVQLLQAGEE
jgi:ATP-binding cassette, subfamily C, bacterial